MMPPSLVVVTGFEDGEVCCAAPCLLSDFLGDNVEFDDAFELTR